MAQLVNPLAPSLAGELSPEAAAAVADIRARGKLRPLPHTIPQLSAAILLSATALRRFVPPLCAMPRRLSTRLPTTV